VEMRWTKMRFKCDKCGTEFEATMYVRCPKCGETANAHPIYTYAHARKPD